MGSASSRVARKLPRTASSRVPPVATTQSKGCGPEKLAFESKNDVVERDANDPHFMEKLNQLGPVRVDHHMRAVRTASGIQHTRHSNVQSESEAAYPGGSTENHLPVSSLVELLEARKSEDKVKLESLARRYHINMAKLDQIARVVNTPSVDESTVVRTRDKYGEESLTILARWTSPYFPVHKGMRY